MTDRSLHSWRKPLGALMLWLACAVAGGVASAQSLPQPATAQSIGSPSSASAELSATAERIYASTRPSLLQVRTLVEAAGRQSSVGSGFLVSADGLAITNYHVVSQYALEPKTYRLEFARPDGTHGALSLLAIDIADDLAVVRLEGADLPHMDFDPVAVAGELPRGERIYAMGNPLDLGFTIVEGTYNGLVERSYNERVQFTGAINPGMSGGPAVTDSGKVVGINVAKRLDGELVSFLVPGNKAVALLELAQECAIDPSANARGDRSADACLAKWLLQGDRGEGFSHDHIRALSGAGKRCALVRLLGSNERRANAQATRADGQFQLQFTRLAIHRRRFAERPRRAHPYLCA